MTFNWVAHYADGSILRQSEGAVYGDVERERLVAFDLWQGERLVVRVDLRDVDVDGEVEGRRLIWRIRHRKTMKGEDLTVNMIGWQRNVRGRNVQSICYVFEDASILMGGQFVAGGAIPMHEIAPLECEADLIE